MVVPALPGAPAYALALWLDEDDTLVAATGLTSRTASSAFTLSLSEAPTGAATMMMAVYSDESLLSVDAPIGQPAIGAAVRLAVPGDAILPIPAWAGRGEWSDDPRLEPVDPRSIPELTTSWLGACPDPCGYLPFENGEPLSLFADLEDALVVVPWDSARDAALVLTSQRRAFRVTSTAATQLAGLVPDEMWEGALAPDDTVWLTAATGGTYRGRPELGFTPVDCPGGLSFGPRLVILPDGVVYFVTDTGIVARFDGSACTVAYAAPSRDVSSKMDIALDEEQRVVAVLKEWSEVITLGNGTPLIERSIPLPTSVAQIPGFGLVVGTVADPGLDAPATLFVRSGDTWDLLAGGRKGPSIGGFTLDRIIPTGRGFLFGGVRGFLGYYEPHIGACAEQPLAGHTVNQAVKLGERHILLAGERVRTAPGSLTRFTLAESGPRGLRCAGVR